MDTPHHHSRSYGGPVMYADQVLVGDELVGISSGRCFSVYSQQMLSLASVDVAHAEEGTEVEVLWGDPGTRQKRIRAIVSRFPYLDLPRNRDIDLAAVAVPV